MTNIELHEGAKYLVRIHSAVNKDCDGIMVDVYQILQAVNCTSQPIGHAVKKLLFPGTRDKGDYLSDLKGALAAINRAIDQEEQRLTQIDRQSIKNQKDPISQAIEKRAREKMGVKVEPHWEAVPCYLGENDPNYDKDINSNNCYGWRVRWSEPDDQMRYLWVRHYLTDFKEGSPSLKWCEVAAKRNAQSFNESGRLPCEFPSYRENGNA